MKYVSTRSKSKPVIASEAIRQGLAPDGGLYVPEKWPVIDLDQLKDLEFPQFAARLLAPFFADDPLEKFLPEICRRAFDFPLVIKKMSDDHSILELFHGPTCAFKDFGARFLALCTEKIEDPRKNERLVLVATSGDTGGAVAAAFKSLTKIPVVVLYPKGRISQRQEKQLTVWGSQVRAIAVEGTFDDCQRIVKEAFLSPNWQKKHQLISANSINLARLLPQMAYFAFARLKSKDASFIVPSGNVGNATAALWAQHLGFSIRQVVLAHNANKTVPNYFNDGKWDPQKSVDTLANAMDVGNPSNFERIHHLFPDIQLLKERAAAFSVSDEQIRETIKTSFSKQNLICPHTATAEFVRSQLSAGHWVTVATAHPAKFETIIEPLIGQTVEVPKGLSDLLSQPSVSITIGPTLAGLEGALS